MSTSVDTTEAIGSCCLVLHSHLPWLAHHGTWPVGEEWLYQSWAQSYLPLVELVERLAAEGRRDVLTLGLTPVLAAQLDDPHCLRAFHHWLGAWQTRAHHAATMWRSRDGEWRDLAAAEHRNASHALGVFEQRWRHGLSPLLRPLLDSGAVELLGGPATHPFAPLLEPPLREFALRVGLDDTRLRLGHRPSGVWAPECGYSPGMEREYAAAGVTRFLADFARDGDVGQPRPVSDGGVVCFGLDTAVSERVWSGDRGYPGHPAYRDFHTFDHESGIKPARVTGKDVAPGAKEPYRPESAARAVDEHVRDFVAAVVDRLGQLRRHHGRSGVVVAAFDTELFGHWWYEGPRWLEGVLRALPEAGVRVTTPGGALRAGHLGDPVRLPPASWGAGHDWRTWAGAPVADLAESGQRLQRRLLAHLHDRHPAGSREHALDQTLRETLLALSSDWAFMVTHDTAAGYARERADRHTARTHHLLDLLEAGRTAEAEAVAARLRGQDGPFGHLDARSLNA